MVLLIYLLTLVDDSQKLEHWPVKGIIKHVDEIDNILVAEPQFTTLTQNGVLILDRDNHLWLIDRMGNVKLLTGKGQGPGEIRPPVRDFYTLETPQGEQVVLQHGSGFWQTWFDSKGKHIQSKQTEWAMYWDPTQRITLMPEDRWNAMSAVNIQWFTGNEKESLPALDPGIEDQMSYTRFKGTKSGSYYLIYNDCGIKRTLYYTLLDLKRKEVVGRDSFRLMDQRRKREQFEELHALGKKGCFPLLEGVTSHPEFGFIFTEYTSETGEYVVLRLLNPKTRKLRAIQIALKGLPRLAYFQYMGDNRWLAYSHSRGIALLEIEQPP